MFVLHCRRFAPTLFPLWGNNRADDIRPYMAYATKFPLGDFGGTDRVGWCHQITAAKNSEYRPANAKIPRMSGGFLIVYQLIRTAATTRRPLSWEYSQVDRQMVLSPYSGVTPVSYRDSSLHLAMKLSKSFLSLASIIW